jgi:two-component system response regulator AtoC
VASGAVDDLVLTGAATVTAKFRLPPEGVNMEEVERQLLTQALERTHGNQSQAAHLLGLNRDQVRLRIEKFGLQVT